MLNWIVWNRTVYLYKKVDLPKPQTNKQIYIYIYMLRAVLNKSWRQHPTRLQLYGHLPPITKTLQVRRTRHAGHCWRSKDELISDVLLWTPTYGRAKAGRPARTYIQQLCEDTGCNSEDLPEAMNDREKWRERVRDIRAGGATWWWWWWWWYIHIYIYIYIYIMPLRFEKAITWLAVKGKGKSTHPKIILFYRLHFQSIIVNNFTSSSIVGGTK